MVEALCGSSLKCTNLIASVDRSLHDEIQVFRAEPGTMGSTTGAGAAYPPGAGEKHSPTGVGAAHTAGPGNVSSRAPHTCFNSE